MTKAELIDAIANESGVSKSDAESAVGAFFDIVTNVREGGRQGHVAGLRVVQYLEV